jgi:NAD(P)-dependent dehydrogenase (short-subunit alcohol dehydrogenase family)
MSVSRGPVTFGAQTTAAEVIDGVDLHGRRAVVTGASSGIGVETARALAAAGAEVTLAVRDTDAGTRVAAGLAAELPSAATGARVVSVSSIGHMFSPVVFDDLDYRFRPYDPWTSYGQSKTANILFAVGAAERWATDGITVNALMPGNVGGTSLARHMDPQELARFAGTGLALPPQKTVVQGAATSVLLAASPTVEGVTGRYFEDCAPAAPVTERAGATAGVAPYALDPDNAARLWTVSEGLLR